MPKLNEIHEKYKDKGLVLLAIHSDPDHVKGAAATTDQGMKYPVAFDGGKFMKTLGCDSFPDYAVVDKAGNLRFVDLANAEIERAVVALLEEK